MRTHFTFIFIVLITHILYNNKEITQFDVESKNCTANILQHNLIFAKSLIRNKVYNFPYKQNTLIRDSLPHLFEALLKLNNMTFNAPRGYIELKPINNGQMEYEAAYKNPSEKFEVRYAIRNHDYNYPKQIFEMTVLNISGGFLPTYTTFTLRSVKKEFGASEGATVVVEPVKEFGSDYKYCLLVYIHKKDVGDGYIFYLADNIEIINRLMEPIFHALRFKNR
ncbi:MAG: hypothetical protein WBP41_18030 [Saprospiraceae bacterium]